MFFVFGSPRSGTTLLAASLDLHDSIVIPDETDFIIPVAFIMDRVHDELTGKALIKRLITSTARFKLSLGRFLTEEEVAKAVDASSYSCAAVLRNLYARVAEKAGKSVAGDKSPNDLGYFGMLIQTQVLAADIKVIHIVRDVRDQLVSLIRTGWTSEPETFPQAGRTRTLGLPSTSKTDNSNISSSLMSAWQAIREACWPRQRSFWACPFKNGCWIKQPAASSTLEYRITPTWATRSAHRASNNGGLNCLPPYRNAAGRTHPSAWSTSDITSEVRKPNPNTQNSRRHS